MECMLVGLALSTDIVSSFLLCTERTITRDWLGGQKCVCVCVIDTESGNGGDIILFVTLFISTLVYLFQPNFLLQ